MRHAGTRLLGAGIVTALTLLAPRVARAQTSRAFFGFDVEGFGLRHIDTVNGRLFGIGGGGSLHGEVNVLPVLGVHLGGTVMYATNDQSPSGAAYYGLRAGLRLHWGVLLGLRGHDGWLDAHYDFGQSGAVSRSGFDVGLGFGLSLARGFRVGPFVRYQWASDPIGQDPQWITFGLSIGLLGDPRTDEPAPANNGPADFDRDGVLDAEDLCPNVPQGANPDPTRRGCPQSDQDGDGVLDRDDVCPTVPAGAQPDPRRRGCPAVDSDADGIGDAEDVCPTVPAGAQPDPDRRGCPQRDGDSDGVPDGRDQCPAVPAGARPDPNRPGCPVGDRDRDTVVDPDDHCPDQPGAPSMDPARNGCPGLVRIDQGQIRILQPVFFATNRDVILDASFPVLRAVADAMQASDIRRLRIEGHTDNRGNARRNLNLSQRRALSVQRWLVEHGIPAAHLEAQGFGMERPIEDNHTPLGRAANRRVEFHILEIGNGG